METLILILVAVGGLGAFVIGTILLLIYFRGGRDKSGAEQGPVIYGNLVQCPHCGYMNPVESAACLNCRQPLPRVRGYAQAPTYAPPDFNYGPPVVPPIGPPAARAPIQPPVPVQATAPAPAPASASGSSPAMPPFPFPPASQAGTVLPNAWLEGVSGAISGQRIMLTQPDMLVGRSTVCDIQVYDPKVSRRHFLIRFGNGAFFVQDQQSSRGTRINGQRVMAQRLQDGDLIEVGDTGMTFHIQS